MALLSVIVAIDEVRAWVPAAILSASMVPFATAALAVGSVRWALPRKAWTAIDDCMYRTYMRLTLFVFETTSGVQLHLYGDVAELKRARESALVISNHQSNCDWAVVNMLAARQSPEGAETGLRFVMKYAISFVPLFGWYVFQHGYIYVRRFGNFTPAPLLRQFAHLRELGTPFWLHIFPEGTRFSKKKQDKIDASQKFAQERNLPIPQFTLIPRAGAFTLAVSELRDSLDAVYDLTIAYGQTKLKPIPSRPSPKHV
uniref:PlsC domain-containing protein n=1 Tax=Panagrellus redivivus TaxID=6233 RepID=A0A7E4VRR5_PANRE